jgi:hypothetical protein
MAMSKFHPMRLAGGAPTPGSAPALAAAPALRACSTTSSKW